MPHKRLLHFPLAGIVLSIFLLAAFPASHAALPQAVSEALSTAHIPDDAIGIVVLRGDSIVLAHNAKRSMQPASTLKVVTTMVALDQLGPLFRGRTELRSAAPIVKGTLKGDLYLRGGADADFNSEVLAHMLQSLRNQGISKIDGRLVLDRELFHPARPDLSAPAFDEAPEARFNVVPDALLLNMNLLQLELRSNGTAVQVAVQPALDGVTVTTDMRLVDGDCEHWDGGWRTPEYVRGRKGKLKLIIHGSFPLRENGCTQSD